MKNQYVGDIGDYGKYSLLSAFADAGIKVGVNWYLTENDGSSDGKFTSYLQKASQFRHYDPLVFDALTEIDSKGEGRSVYDVQNSGILPGAVFYPELLFPKGDPDARKKERERWFEASLPVLQNAELIFLDPDNGLLDGGKIGRLGAEKYVISDEIGRYFERGQNVVYYCHKGRRTETQWFEYKGLMFSRFPEAKPAILTFHKGTQRSYIFLLHKKDFEVYRRIIDQVKRQWFRVFTEEYTCFGDPASDSSGEKITLEKSDGEVITLSKRADGQLEIRSSRNPNCSTVLSADHFCRINRI